MTLPYEEKNALVWAERFLESLLYPEKTPGVPRAVRQEALRVLRHYPARYRVERMYREKRL